MFDVFVVNVNIRLLSHCTYFIYKLELHF